MGLGPYLQPASDRAGRRMASEDSRYRDRARFKVHPLCDSGDLGEAVFVEMRSRLHHPQGTEANASKSARFAVTSGYASKNGTTTSTSSLLRFTEKRRSVWRWLSWRRFSMICSGHPNTS